MPNPHNAERICTIYFENANGYVIVAPDHAHPTPQGYERKEARTLHDIDLLTKRLNTQDQNYFNHLMAQDRAQILAKHAQIKSRLGQRLLAIDCSPFERLFIRRSFAYLDRKAADLVKCEVSGYFHQREYDSPGNDPLDSYGKQLVMPKMSDRLASLLTK